MGERLSTEFDYCEHFESIKMSLPKLDKNDATSIEKILDLQSDPEVELNLIYIKSNLRTLLDSINN